MDGEHELHLIPGCVFEFYVGVNRCPDRGVAGTLNNRGHDDWPEITYWPRKIYHARTTGKEFKALGFSAAQPRLNEKEKQICAILGLKEWELATFLRNWTPTHSKEKYPDTIGELAEQLHRAGYGRTQTSGEEEMNKRMTSSLGGTNANHWINPWERDTTRGGYGDLCPFPSMHSSELQATVLIASCECCGVSFGYMPPDDPRPFCPSHSWLGTVKPLGKLFLTGIRYLDAYDTQKEVTGRGIRYSYFFPESDPREAQKLWLALRVWLQAEYLEQVGLERLPKVTLTKEGVLVSDLQHLQRRIEGNGTSASSIGSETLERLMRKMDQIYVEAL